MWTKVKVENMREQFATEVKKAKNETQATGNPKGECEYKIVEPDREDGVVSGAAGDG